MQLLGQRGVGDPALALEDREHPAVDGVQGHDHLLNQGRRGRSLRTANSRGASRHHMPPIPRDTACMLSTRTATALYVGAVLGPGVLILPALAAEAAGPASVLAWVALLALSAPLAITFAALGVRHPEAGGTAAYARAAFGPRAGGVTGWWFLAGVVLGAPAVALIGGFYVAELVGAGREGAVAAAAGMMAAVMAANAVGLRTSARLQLGLAGLLAALLLVAIVTALPREPRRALGPVRAARLGRDRHRGEPAHALVHRLGGRLAPGRRAARPGAPAPARDLRRARRRRRALPRPGRRDGRRAGHRGAVAGAARRSHGGRARRARPHRDRGARGAAHDGRDERLRRRRRQARRRAGRGRLGAGRARPSGPRPRPVRDVGALLLVPLGADAAERRGPRAGGQRVVRGGLRRQPPRPACGCSPAPRASPRPSRSSPCSWCSRSPVRSCSSRPSSRARSLLRGRRRQCVQTVQVCTERGFAR